jgi:hypothetical protein
MTRLCIFMLGSLCCTVLPASADPRKDESGKGRERWEKWDEKRWKEEKKAREKARERAEKAWEQRRKEEEKYREQQRKWPERDGRSYRYDDDIDEGYYVPRYETRRPVYRDEDYYYRDSRPSRYYEPPIPQPYYDGRYYPGRGALKGSRIGARIGDLIGGPEGARIGAEIGAEIGEETDR